MIDATAVAKGKGFAGGMKRHNFSGQGAAHGNHKHHRAPGSIGACATPGRVFKGTKMAGRMGGVQVTTTNLEVICVDVERHLVLVKGAVPGPRGGVVVLRTSREEPHEGRRYAMSDVFTLRGPIKKDRPAPAERTVDAQVLDGDGARRGRPRADDLRHRAQHGRAAPSDQGPTRRQALGNPVTKTRKEVAVAGASPSAKGHRRRAPGHHPRAALPGRWHRARTQAAQVRPEDPQEDDPPGAALGPVGPRRDGARRARRQLRHVGDAPRPRTRIDRARGPRSSTARSWWCSDATTRRRFARFATS